MPIKAFNEERTVVAPLLSDAEWESLRHELRDGSVVMRLPCCESECFSRESKLGTRHFYHKRGADCSSPRETLEHLLAKERILLGGRDAGFQMDAEASGDGWRADVLAQKGTAKIAIEVQWSSQTLQDTELRHEKYKSAGIRCAWLFRRLLKGSRPSRELPMFKLDFSDRSNPTVKGQPLRGFARDMLSGKYKFCERTLVATEQELTFQVHLSSCWKCKQSCHIFRVLDEQGGLLSKHGEPIAYLDDGFDNGVSYCNEALRFMRERVMQDNPQFRFGEIKNRSSKTRRESYMSQGCPSCDALFGDFYLHSDIDMQRIAPILEHEIRVAFPKRVSVEKPHWCYSETKQFCS